MQEALARLPDLRELTNEQASTWWRLRGMLHQHAGAYALAEQAYREAAEVVPNTSLRFGEARFATAVLLGLQGHREDAIAAYLDARERLRTHHKHAHLAVVNYNLGWSLAQLMRLDLAAESLESDLLSTERGEARQHAGLLHFGRAYLFTLLGEYDRARSSAAWAATLERSIDVRVRIQHLLVQLLWLSGDLQSTRMAIHDLLAGEGREASRLTRQSLQLTEDILSGNAAALEEAFRQEEHSLRVRAGLYSAHLALLAGDETYVTNRMRAVMTVEPTPAQLQFEAPFLPELYTWCREHGFSLPTPASSPPMEVQLQIQGPPILVISGRPAHVRLSPEAAAVTAYLINTGEAEQNVICRHVLGKQGPSGRSALTRALHRLRIVFGSRECVRLEAGIVQLNSRWKWTLLQGTGTTAFASLDSEFTRNMELRRFDASSLSGE